MGRKILYNALATSVNVLGGLLRNKIIAAFLSLGLFGIFSLGQQSVSVLVALFGFGLPLGVTTVSSQLVTRGEEEQRETVSKIVVLVGGMGVGVFLIFAAVIAVVPALVGQIIAGDAGYSLPIAILILSAPFMIVENCLYAVMEGMGRLREIVLFKIAPALVSLPVLYVLASTYGLTGAAIGLLVSEILLVSTALYLLRDLIIITRSAMHVFEIFAELVKIAVLSLAVGGGWFIVDFVVKRHLLALLGEASNGIIQSVAKITDLYPNIALAWLSMHLFPTIAMGAGDKSTSANALERTVLVAVAIIVPVIIVLFTFRDLVLEIVYKKEFTVAHTYFGAMLSIGILRVFSWVVGLALLPLGLKKQWFMTAYILIIVYPLAIWIALIFGSALYAIPLAYGVGLIIQGGGTLLVLRRHGIVFGREFAVGTSFVLALTGLLVLSIFWTPGLALAACGYAWLLVRFKLIVEFRDLLRGLGKKAAA
jgi:PST family polysaccharide transporter